MADIITAANLLLNAFRSTNKDIISIAELNDLRRNIEFELDTLYIDISKDSLMEAVLSYPEIFIWEDDGIHCKRPIRDDINLNFLVPSYIKAKYLSIIEKFFKGD